jgi:hypothetical protein
LLSRENICSVDNLGSLSILGRMIPNINVLGAFMYLRTMNQPNAGLVVGVEGGGNGGRISNFGEEVAEPNDLAGGGPSSNILGFSRTGRGDRLFL